MGAFGLVLWIVHYVGLYVQVSAASQPVGDVGVVGVDNHISGNALFMFTEVPHDIVTQSGRDVEMACSFRGAGPPSVSLEIQWWYIRNHKEWTEKPSWTTNQVVPMEELPKDATKISVVKVAGSNISHKLRLSSVKPADEGIYECLVIDFSDSRAQHHRVRAFLQVQPPGSAHQSPDAQLHHGNRELQEGDQLHNGDHKLHRGDHHDEGHQLRPHEQEEEPEKQRAHNHRSEGRELKRHSTGTPNDCTTDGCVL